MLALLTCVDGGHVDDESDYDYEYDFDHDYDNDYAYDYDYDYLRHETNGLQKMGVIMQCHER